MSRQYNDAMNGHTTGVLAIGNLEHTEFRAAAELLRSGTDLVVCGSVEHATNWLYAANPPPQWIVIFQSLPGQFSRDVLGVLWRLAPLARMVRVLGSWCEGEIRTGQPWPGAIRMYWHQAPVRIAAALRSVALGRPPWPLAPTATEEDRLIVLPKGALSYGERLLVGIRTQTLSAAESFADACSNEGYMTVWLQPGRPVFVRGLHACLWDFAHSSNAEFEAMAKFHAQHLDVRVLALLDFPRVDDQKRAGLAGASALVSKPLMLDDLFWTLNEVLGDVQEQARPLRSPA